MDGFDSILSERANLSVLSSDDKQTIEELYTQLLNKPFIKRAGCADCYRDALLEIKIHLKHSKMKYSLKKGALVFDHSQNEYYTDANLTDEAAERVLSASPSLINQFETFPIDWGNPKKPMIEASTHNMADGSILTISTEGNVTDQDNEKVKVGTYLTNDGGKIIVSSKGARYEAPAKQSDQ